MLIKEVVYHRQITSTVRWLFFADSSAIRKCVCDAAAPQRRGNFCVHSEIHPAPSISYASQEIWLSRSNFKSTFDYLRRLVAHHHHTIWDSLGFTAQKVHHRAKALFIRNCLGGSSQIQAPCSS
jgi:hypothetical protein